MNKGQLNLNTINNFHYEVIFFLMYIISNYLLFQKTLIHIIANIAINKVSESSCLSAGNLIRNMTTPNSPRARQTNTKN